MPPIGFETGRYELPRTEYFDAIRRSIPLGDLAVYAQSEQGAEVEEYLLERGLRVPLSGPHHYSPGGAAIVERARQLMDTDRATSRWARAAVFSPGTAILGLGSAPFRPQTQVVMAGAGGPIMIGKSAYFLMSAGVDTEPITVEAPLRPDQLKALDAVNGAERKALLRRFAAENFAYVVAAQSKNYGFINIEDADGASLPYIWDALKEYGVDSVYWSDDRQGTGVIVAGGVLSWAHLTGRLKEGPRPLEGIRVVIFGAGAGARGVRDELVNQGVRPEDILVTDSGINKDRTGRGYPLHQGREDVLNDPIKWEMARYIPARTTIKDFARGADIVINLGVKEAFTYNLHWTRELTAELARDPLFLALTNPDPGITPEQLREVRDDAYYGSGNQRYVNPFNNFVAFAQMGLASLLSRARTVTSEMTVAASRGIFKVAQMNPNFGRDWLVPHPLELELIEHEAGAAALAAVLSGASTLYSGIPGFAEQEAFKVALADKLRYQTERVKQLRADAETNGPRYFKTRYGDRYAPFHLGMDGYNVVPEVNQQRFAELAREMGTVSDRWSYLTKEDGTLKPDALTVVLKQLQEGSVGETLPNETARRELKIILQIAFVHPALGLALAVRRTRVRPENLAVRPTLFDREEVMRVVSREVPEALGAIEELKRWIAVQNKVGADGVIAGGIVDVEIHGPVPVAVAVRPEVAAGNSEDNSGTPRALHNADVWAHRDEVSFADDGGAALQIQPDPAEIVPTDTTANDGVYNDPLHRMSRMAGQYRVLRTRATSTGTMLRVIGR